jgi:hypothetical protein
LNRPPVQALHERSSEKSAAYPAGRLSAPTAQAIKRNESAGGRRDADLPHDERRSSRPYEHRD